jgi:hypothetical protein
MAKIGIRLADGKFYPILEEGAAAKKRLIVTTVKDDQPSVQIDVYRSVDGEIADTYVGSLIVENIPPRSNGEPDIRLDLGLDDDGNLTAFAREEITGEHQALSVSLKSLAEEEKYDIPDFDFQGDEDLDLTTDDLPEIDSFDTGFTEVSDDDEQELVAGPSASRSHGKNLEDGAGRKKRYPVLIGVLAAIATAIILIAAFFIYTCTVDRQPEPPMAPTVQAPTPAPEPPKAVTPAPVPAPAAVEPPKPTPEPPKAVPEKAAPAKKAGTWYKIRWGDTLWDISIAYYRTPWLYSTIAKANKIRNPDLIISATWIFIPPR